MNLTGDIAVLTPGLNQTGVKWNGGDVEITEGGNYQITHTESVDNFAAFDRMTLSASNVFLNGDYKTITLTEATGDNGEAILVKGTSLQNVTLDKLNVTMQSGVKRTEANSWSAVKFWDVTGAVISNSIIDLSNLNAGTGSPQSQLNNSNSIRVPICVPVTTRSQPEMQTTTQWA